MHPISFQTLLSNPGFARQVQSGLFVFDFDGTLVPVQKDPERIRLAAPVLGILRRFMKQVPAALLSGRGRGDVAGRAGGEAFPWKEIIGNHGLEWKSPLPGAQEWVEKVRHWERTLLSYFQGVSNLILEAKDYSISIHFGLCPDPQAIEGEVDHFLTVLKPDRILPGKFVRNLLPTRTVNKGTALQRLAEKYPRENLFFFGDDVTDEDGFQVCREKENWYSIHVGNRKTIAKYRVESPKEVLDFLDAHGQGP